MKRRIFCVLLALLLLALVSLACGMGSSAPPGAVEPTFSSQPTSIPESTVTPPSTPQVEERVAEVEWPASMRVGDSDIVRLSLIPAAEGYVAEPEIEGHEVEPEEVPMVVVRPGYTGYAITTLSAAGLETVSAAPEEQLLVPGQPNVWRWTVSPATAGTYRVVVNLAVRWTPEAGTDLPGPFEEAVWSRTLTIEARSTLGLSGKQADWIGVGGSLIGAVSGLPFTGKLLELLWKRVRHWWKSPAARDIAKPQ
jgi:hypothetical protein